MSAFEVYETPDGSARFYFSHSDKEFTTGILVLNPKAELSKHNRPHAIENLIQISGRCVMKLFETPTQSTDHTLLPGTKLVISKGMYHLHSIPFDEESTTFFKAEGDITEIMDKLRQTNMNVTLN